MPSASTADVFDRFARSVSPYKAEVWKKFGMDFVIGRREGVYIWNLEGTKRLLNCHVNGGTFNLGHRHPRLVQALRNALESLDIGNHHFVSAQRAALAQRLAELTPGDIQYTVFGVGGGEAIDVAIKLARGHTGRSKVVSAFGGYHGHTGLALAAGDARYRAPFGPPAPGFAQVPFGDFEALERALDEDTAAVLFETVPATSGMPLPDPDFHPRVRELCDRRGVVLIVDEVQTGLGRTGRIWGIEHYGVVPDVLVSAKGLSGGIYPITATCLRPHLLECFREDPFIHVSTFGGAELGCVVALELLDLVASPRFLERVNALAAWYADALAKLREKHARLLLEVRQLGLFMGLRYAHPQGGPLMTKLCYEAGMFALYASHDHSVQQFLPPLVISDAEAQESVACLDESLGRLASLAG